MTIKNTLTVIGFTVAMICIYALAFLFCYKTGILPVK